MVKLEPMAPHLQRVLAFVKLANAGGAYPDHWQIDQYARTPEPAGPMRRSMVASLTALAQLPSFQEDGEPLASYLANIGWIARRGSGFELTELGQALVIGLGDAGSRPPEVRALVLRPEDPARYEVLVRALSAAGEGMLADPYFKAEFIELLVTGTNITRLLVSKNQRDSKAIRKLISLALGRLADGNTGDALEVRATGDQRFHDRYLLHRNGTIDLVGASVNSLDTSFTILVPLPNTARPIVASFLDELWNGADLVPPESPSFVSVSGQEPETDAP